MLYALNTILIFKDCRKMCSCYNILGEAISVIDSRSQFAFSNLPSATIQEWCEHQTILTVDKEFKIDFVKQGRVQQNVLEIMISVQSITGSLRGLHNENPNKLSQERHNFDTYWSNLRISAIFQTWNLSVALLSPTCCEYLFPTNVTTMFHIIIF